MDSRWDARRRRLSASTPSPAGTAAAGAAASCRAGCPLVALNTQVWKSEQPGSSPFRSGQGTGAESGPPEEIAGHFPAVAGSLHVTPLVGPSQQVFLGAERKRKKPGSWLLGSSCQTQPHERGREGWREGRGKREASCHILTHSSIQLSRDSFEKEPTQTAPNTSGTLKSH